MKKTVQIVTLPLDKEGWSKGDIINDGYVTSLSIFDVKDSKFWQAQQLLVLSDDEIQEDDIRYSFHDKDWYHTSSSDFEDGIQPCKKVIASYPHIEGTAPITKETVQAWIDAGTPKEGNVEKDADFEDWYERLELNTYPCWKPVVDSQGNLKIEFGKESDIRYEPRLDTRGSVSLECRVEVKPQPDFQAIFSKAKEIADDICKRSFLPTEGDFYEGLVVGIDTGLHICADKNKQQ